VCVCVYAYACVCVRAHARACVCVYLQNIISSSALHILKPMSMTNGLDLVAFLGTRTIHAEFGL
jgi:hypothetical protein